MAENLNKCLTNISSFCYLLFKFVNKRLVNVISLLYVH